MRERVYLTTTLPYVNADPHIGFALEIVQTDIIARYHRLLGKEVFFNTGTDEHGLKIYRKAIEEGKDPQAYVDEYAAKFDQLKQALDLSYDNFIRTTDPDHKKAAQEFWKRCKERGDIEKKKYKIKYCVGCELEKTESELENGCCPLHPNLEIEIIEEENYFFKFSNYQKPLLEYYEKHPDFVVPDFRFNEIKAFVNRGLVDFSISRLKKKMPWGVPVPDDSDHVMYVWFDALVNYISAIGWPFDMKQFEKWWPVVQFAGKDNLRQQTAMWPAMLLSAGLSPSKQIVIHGFITSSGKKMSKSLGNVIEPIKIVDEYGTDALRYYLARHVHPFEDSDFTEEKFKEIYNANLVNGLGNLLSRIFAMDEKNVKLDEEYKFLSLKKILEQNKEYTQHMNNYEINKACDLIWRLIADLDKFIQEEKPFLTIKENESKAVNDIIISMQKLYEIMVLLLPILPNTAEDVITQIS